MMPLGFYYGTCKSHCLTKQDHLIISLSHFKQSPWKALFSLVALSVLLKGNSNWPWLVTCSSFSQLLWREMENSDWSPLCWKGWRKPQWPESTTWGHPNSFRRWIGVCQLCKGKKPQPIEKSRKVRKEWTSTRFSSYFHHHINTETFPVAQFPLFTSSALYPWQIRLGWSPWSL